MTELTINPLQVLAAQGRRLLAEKAYQVHHRMLAADALAKSDADLDQEPDDWIREGAQLIRLQLRDEGQPTELTPRQVLIAKACELLHSPDIFVRETLDARLIAGESIGEIAARSGLEADLIEAYQAMCFDVSDDDRLHFAIGAFRLCGDNRGLPSTPRGRGLLWGACRFGKQDLERSLEKEEEGDSDHPDGERATW